MKEPQGNKPQKGDLSEAFLKAAGDYMLIETPLAKADLCILFGNSKADLIANHAADLYEQGYFTRMVVTGGVATDDGRLEADRMRDVLVARGVPVENILVEDDATNTGENVIHTLALLKKNGWKDDVHSVIGVGRLHASRRFIMTLEKHWPEVTKMFSAPNNYGVPPQDFMRSDEFREDVLREFNKITPYKEKGFIAEIDPVAMAEKIRKLPHPANAPAPKMRHRSEGPKR
ncbi:MAG: YdcF family protein [Alphaproteobacteria bacterium]|nr:YdcF family protein [Alphaproteobacteria bacterium]